MRKEEIMKLEQNAAPGIYKHVIKLLNKDPGNILDLGCGSGIVSELIKKNNPELKITCSDFNKTQYKGSFRFINADLNKSKLPFENSSFNSVLLIEVIEHVKNPWQLIEETHRILKKDGILIITTPNVENLQSRVHFLLQTKFFSFLDSDMPKHKKPGMGHINPMFDFQLKNIMDDKFKIIDKKYNRIRIPFLKHNIPTNLSILGEIKIIKLKKI